MEIDSKRLSRILNEELNKSDVEKIVDDKFKKHLKSKDLSNEINNIVADVLDEFFRNMWTKNAFWKHLLKKK